MRPFREILSGAWARIRRFSAPAPETRELQELLVGLARTVDPFSASRREWLNIVVRSPYLRNPLLVHEESFADVEFTVLRPTSEGAVATARRELDGVSGRRRYGVARDLQASGDLVPLDEGHPAQSILRANVRRWSGRRWRAMSCLYHAAVGESFQRVGRDDSAVAREFVTVSPADVVEVPDGRRRFYRLRDAPGLVQEQNVFEWSRPDPTRLYGRGRGVVQSLAEEVMGSEYFARFFRGYFKSSAIPAYMFVYRGAEGEADMRRRIDRGHRGVERAHRGLVLRAPDNNAGPVRDDFVMQELGDRLDPRKMQEYALWIEGFVRRFLRVPPSLTGNFEDNSGLGMSGVQLERFVFLDTVLMPLAIDFADSYESWVRAEYDDRLRVTFAPFLEEDRDYRLRAMEAFSHVYTVDEQRAASGAAPHPDSVTGRSHVVPVGNVIRPNLRPGQPELAAVRGSGT